MNVFAASDATVGQDAVVAVGILLDHVSQGIAELITQSGARQSIVLRAENSAERSGTSMAKRGNRVVGIPSVLDQSDQARLAILGKTDGNCVIRTGSEYVLHDIYVGDCGAGGSEYDL